MNYYLTYFIGTLLRFFPVPTKPRIIRIGNPDRNSPVLLTGNFVLTVEVVKRHLKGLNVYLLVANSVTKPDALNSGTMRFLTFTWLFAPYISETFL